jgi:hypothetical protein
MEQSISPAVTSVKVNKYLSADNTWNSEGLIQEFNPSEDQMFKCEKTQKPLFYIRKDGTKIMLDTFGMCDATGKYVHYTELSIKEGVDKPPYPMELMGYMQKDEYVKPLTPKELAEIRKEHGI